MATGASRQNNLQLNTPRFTDILTPSRIGSRDHVATLQARICSLEGFIRNSLPSVPDSKTMADMILSPKNGREALSSSQDPLALRSLDLSNGLQGNDNHLIQYVPLSCRRYPPASPSRILTRDRLLTPTSSQNGLEIEAFPPPTQPVVDPALMVELSSAHATNFQTPQALIDTQASPSNMPFCAPPGEHYHALSTPTIEAESTERHGHEASFFGPTSEPHVSSPSDAPRPKPDRLKMPCVELRTDSPQLKALLFRSYWSYQTLCVCVVDEETFCAHSARGSRSQYYSEFLESALLACSTRLSTSKAVRALGPEYVGRAKTVLNLEIENANIATLQGLLLLSDYEMSQGRDRVGWMYCGELKSPTNS
jgi:hypothetical protein